MNLKVHILKREKIITILENLNIKRLLFKYIEVGLLYNELSLVILFKFKFIIYKSILKNYSCSFELTTIEVEGAALSQHCFVLVFLRKWIELSNSNGPDLTRHDSGQAGL